MKMNLLDIFSGSQNLRKHFIKAGFNVVSIDKFKKYNTAKDTIIVDILEWDYMTYERTDFDVVFLGLPCGTFSKASGGKHFSRLKEPRTNEALISLEILQKCFDIIDYFYNAIFYIENPAGGLESFDIIKSRIKSDDIIYSSFYQIMYGGKTPKHTILLHNNRSLNLFSPYYRRKGKINKVELSNLTIKKRQTYPDKMCEMIINWTIAEIKRKGDFNFK